MKVLLVNGSPHKNGCTHRALQEIQMQLKKEAIDSEIFWIGSTVQGCIGCCQCQESGTCVFDDILKIFLEKAKDTDGFIFGSAVYYGSSTGSLSSFMDRLFFSGSSYLENKPAAAVVSCRRGGASEAFSQINMYFAMCNMPIVPSQYWNQVHGLKPTDVEKDLEGLQTMRTLALNMSWLLKCIEAGKSNGIPLPQREEPIATNFIR